MRKLVPLLIAVTAIFFALGIFIFSRAPSSHPDTTAVVKEIQQLQRLETAQFTIEKIIDAGTNNNGAWRDILFGDKILLIAHGEVIAGFDVSSISQESIQVSGNAITIILPPPQILVSKLDNEKTRVYDRRQGILAQNNKDLESQARQQAEEAIRKAACDANILTQASENAKKQLTTLFKSIGFTQVTIEIPSSNC